VVIGKIVKNKRAWLRILEAFVAVTLIASVLVVLYVRTVQSPKDREEIYNLQKTILDEIAASPELRNATLNDDELTVKNFVKDRIPVSFNFSVRICEVENICSLSPYKKEVYATDRVISANLQTYAPKKVKIFMWKE